MEWVRLKDLFNIQKGKKVERIEKPNDNSIRYIQIDDLRNDNEIKYCEYKEKYVIANKNDIIIAWDGANAGTVGFNLNGAIGSTLAILRPKSKIMSTEFCGLFLKSKFIYLQNTATGATIPHINKNALINLEVPLLDKEEQVKIVEILDKSQSLIDKRKQQIKLLDELIESIFYDMFGDPIKNEKGWEVKELGGYVLNMNNGLQRRGKDKNGDIVLRLVELQSKYIDYSNINKIMLTDKEKDKYELKDMDVIFARVNGNQNYVGRSAVYRRKSECSVFFNDHIIRATFDLTKLNVLFLVNLMNSKFGIKQFKKNIKTSAGQYTINQDGIKSVPIPSPPLPLQNEFASKVEAIEKKKALLESSLKLLEDNYNSLMQRAFKGELF